jgi:predicted N-acetyltransferase YhbS
VEPEVVIRPLRDEEVEAAHAAADAALSVYIPAEIPWGGEAHHRRATARIRHLLATDPDGAWVAARDGEVVGISLGLVREGIWGLSLLAVAPDLHARGIGKQLLDRALAYGDGCRGHLILSSSSPLAMRRYALAGFALRPCVASSGVVNRARLPAPDPRVRDEGHDGIELADAIAREVRGAGHGPDLPHWLALGHRLLTLPDRGFVVHHEGWVKLLAARDEEAAATLLWAALSEAAPGATVVVDFITAGQDWAIPVILGAGLALSTDGPFFVRGDVGPLRPYLPSGAYL